MISTNQFKNGMTIEVDGKLYSIVEFQHVKPGKGGAFVRTKLKDVKTGAVVDKTFRAGEKFEQAQMTRRQMQYLYDDDGSYVFMDTESYEQLNLDGTIVSEALRFLKVNEVVLVVFTDGTPIGLELPTAVELEIVQTDPGVKGDTATGGTKPATLETGTVIQVPLFIQVGEKVKVDTRNGEYLTRA